MKIILIMVMFLTGCEYFGLAYNANSAAKIEFENGDCKLKMYQSTINVGENEIIDYNFSEMISITNECALNLEYSEIETVEDE